MEIAQILTKLMEDRKITAYRIAKDTGISDRLIGYWKSGERVPSSSNVNKLADYFDVSTDYLLGKEAPDDTTKKAPPTLEQAEEAYVLALIENGYIERGKPLTKKEMDRLRKMVKAALED